ncbi:MAG: sugar phosphate isomerase/epimerase family protein [Opitutales bacterium]
MHYAFMTFSCQQSSLADVLALARRTGYDGVEIRAGGDHAHGVEVSLTRDERAAVKQQFADAGIRCACLAISARFADPSEVDQWLDEARKTIDLAGDLDCPILRVFGGELGKGVSRGAAIEAVAAHLKSLATQAADRNVTLALETHDAWCDAAHVAAVMTLADHPNVGVNWDVMHPARMLGYSLEAAFTVLKPWIRHVHFHDALCVPDKLDFRRIGEGEIDHRTVLRLLHSVEYPGVLSGEWIGFGDEAQLTHDRQAMAAFEKELGIA